MSEDTSADITTLTVQLLSAFVSNNSVPSESLADLIRTTRSALTADQAAVPAEAQAATYTPAVSVRKSLSSPDHILSMIDGRPYKTLKRHLATHGLSPDEYRQRYNLPKSYPLVAPSYSEARRAVATRLGLGRKPSPGEAAKAAPAASVAPPSKAAAPAKPAATTPAAAAKPTAAKAAAPKASKAGAKPAAKVNGDKPAAKASAEKPAAKANADKAATTKPAPAKKAKAPRSAKTQPASAVAPATEKAS